MVKYSPWHGEFVLQGGGIIIRRNMEDLVIEAVEHSRVVLVNGPRQSGKTTLVRELIDFGGGASYTTMDDLTSLSFAQRDPSGFIEQFKQTAVIDEIQRVPELFLPIKVAVDRHNRRGAFVLTGSANVFALPRMADSLAGRIRIITLWPLSQGEITGVKENFIDWVFNKDLQLPRNISCEREDIINRALEGGYPEALEMKTERLKRTWMDGYINTLISRDVRDVGNVRDLKDFPVLLNALAIRSSTLLNLSDISRTVGIPHETLRRYMSLLETLWLFLELPAWSANLGRRLTRAPKIIMSDSGLLSSIMNLDQKRIKHEPVYLGQLLESFAVMELRKQAGWSELRTGIFHYRDQKGGEVDIILESPSGDVVGVEVKSTVTPRAEDFDGLRFLQNALGDKFCRGVLLYCGDKIVSPSKDLYALPFSSLWMKHKI